MSKNEENIPVEVYSGSIGEAELVKSLIENAEIRAVLKDEIAGTLVPWQTSSGGLGAVKVIVGSSDYEKAKLVVEEYKKNVNS